MVVISSAGGGFAAAETLAKTRWIDSLQGRAPTREQMQEWYDTVFPAVLRAYMANVEPEFWTIKAGRECATYVTESIMRGMLGCKSAWPRSAALLCSCLGGGSSPNPRPRVLTRLTAGAQTSGTRRSRSATSTAWRWESQTST